MRFRYNFDKNAILLATRGVNFETIIEKINDGCLVDSKPHHNQKRYSNQGILHVRIAAKIYLVPYVVEANGSIFLKTLYPSSKVTKKLLSKTTISTKTLVHPAGFEPTTS